MLYSPIVYDNIKSAPMGIVSRGWRTLETLHATPLIVWLACRS